MLLVSDVLDIAKGEIGYSNAKGHATKYGNWYGVKGFEAAPWCAMFVCWVFAKAGAPLHPIQHKNGFAYCPFGLRWFKDNSQLVKSPQPGDIVFFDWGKDGKSDHVGIVEEVYPTHLVTIEGNTSLRNQSNGRSCMRRTRYYASVCGFARPDYEVQYIAWSGFYLSVTNPLTRGKEVEIVQVLLQDMGYEIVYDGIYGPQTERAVIDFQAKNSLSVDGVVGPITWQRLHS